MLSNILSSYKMGYIYIYILTYRYGTTLLSSLNCLIKIILFIKVINSSRENDSFLSCRWKSLNCLITRGRLVMFNACNMLYYHSLEMNHSDMLVLVNWRTLSVLQSSVRYTIICSFQILILLFNVFQETMMLPRSITTPHPLICRRYF